MNKMQDFSPPTTISAIEAKLVEFVALSQHWTMADTRVDSEIVWAISSVPSYQLNNVAGANLPADDVDKTLETVIALGQTKQVPIIWWIGPSTKPNNLSQCLEKKGFIHVSTIPGMAIDLLTIDMKTPALDNFRITKVESDEALETLNHVAAKGIDSPDYAEKATYELFSAVAQQPNSSFNHYIGWLDNTPVATTSMLLTAEVAGIFNVVTLPEARKRGIGSAMTLHALQEARTQGGHMGVLHASPMGLSVYKNLGFETFCQLELFLWGHQYIQQ